MLRLLFLMAFCGVIFAGASYVFRFRRRDLLGMEEEPQQLPALTASRLAEFRKTAQGKPRLSEGLILRQKLVDSLSGKEQRNFKTQIDQVLSRLFHQEELLKRLKEAVLGQNEEELRDRVELAQQKAGPGADPLLNEKLEKTQEALAQLERLRGQVEELEQNNGQLLEELKSFYSALLEYQAAAALGQGGSLGGAAERLKAASQERKLEARAQAEVERLLHQRS